MDKIYKKTFYVRNFDVDCNGKLKLEMLLNFLQESAAEHADKLGVSGKELLKKNLAWVLSRYHIKITRYPSQGEAIEIVTWPSIIKGIFTLREFEIFSHNTKTAEATSSWLAVDLNKKKPININKSLPEFPMHDKRAVNDDFQRLPDFEKTDFELRFPVLKGNLDFNHHVNNVVYINLAVETIPKKVIMNFRPSRIEVNYKNETFYSDWIISRSQNIDTGKYPQFIHQLVRESDGQEIARLRTAWADL